MTNVQVTLLVQADGIFVAHFANRECDAGGTIVERGGFHATSSRH
ncbi:MAG: hypothetical protein QM785_09630 [Pyrinomonadaceae bacterium]